MIDLTEGSQMRTNAGSPKTQKPNIIPKGQMTNQTNCNHRTPPKHHVDYLDEQMVIVNGVSYTRKEPTLITERKSYGVDGVAMDYTMRVFERVDENTVKIEGVEYKKVIPPTLHKTLLQKTEISPKVCWEICDVVRGWLIDHTVIETEDEEKVTFTIHKEQLQTPK